MITLGEMKKMNTFDELFDTVVKAGQNIREDSITQKAKEVIERGEVLSHYINACHKLHIGNDGLLLLNYLSLFTVFTTGFQLHIYAIGTSGKGKSHAAEIACECMPQNMVERLTSLSGKALMYLQNPDRWNHKLIFIDEYQASENSIEIIKALTSNNRTKPRLLTVDKDATSLRMTRDLEFPGKVAILLTSVNPLENAELLNRFVIANPNESEDIDRRVYDLQRELFSQGKEKTQELPEEILIQRRITELILEEGMDYEVIIPYGRQIEASDKENRRNLNTVLTILKAITIANRHHRKDVRLSDSLVQLEADVEDFRTANAIWSQVSMTSKTKVGEKELKILNMLPEEGEKALDRSYIASFAGYSLSSTRNYLNRLYEAGLINYRASEEHGRTYLYWKSKDINPDQLAYYLKEESKNPDPSALQNTL